MPLFPGSFPPPESSNTFPRPEVLSFAEGLLPKRPKEQSVGDETEESNTEDGITEINHLRTKLDEHFTSLSSDGRYEVLEALLETSVTNALSKGAQDWHYDLIELVCTRHGGAVCPSKTSPQFFEKLIEFGIDTLVRVGEGGSAQFIRRSTHLLSLMLNYCETSYDRVRLCVKLLEGSIGIFSSSVKSLDESLPDSEYKKFFILPFFEVFNSVLEESELILVAQSQIFSKAAEDFILSSIGKVKSSDIIYFSRILSCQYFTLTDDFQRVCALRISNLCQELCAFPEVTSLEEAQLLSTKLLRVLEVSFLFTLREIDRRWTWKLDDECTPEIFESDVIAALSVAFRNIGSPWWQTISANWNEETDVAFAAEVSNVGFIDGIATQLLGPNWIRNLNCWQLTARATEAAERMRPAAWRSRLFLEFVVNLHLECNDPVSAQMHLAPLIEFMIPHYEDSQESAPSKSDPIWLSDLTSSKSLISMYVHLVVAKSESVEPQLTLWEERFDVNDDSLTTRSRAEEVAKAIYRTDDTAIAELLSWFDSRQDDEVGGLLVADSEDDRPDLRLSKLFKGAPSYKFFAVKDRYEFVNDCISALNKDDELRYVWPEIPHRTFTGIRAAILRRIVGAPTLPLYRLRPPPPTELRAERSALAVAAAWDSEEGFISAVEHFCEKIDDWASKNQAPSWPPVLRWAVVSLEQECLSRPVPKVQRLLVEFFKGWFNTLADADPFYTDARLALLESRTSILEQRWKKLLASKKWTATSHQFVELVEAHQLTLHDLAELSQQGTPGRVDLCRTIESGLCRNLMAAYELQGVTSETISKRLRAINTTRIEAIDLFPDTLHFHRSVWQTGRQSYRKAREFLRAGAVRAALSTSIETSELLLKSLERVKDLLPKSRKTSTLDNYLATLRTLGNAYGLQIRIYRTLDLPCLERDAQQRLIKLIGLLPSRVLLEKELR